MMSMIQQLAKRGHRGAVALDAFNPDQPRDERGRWGEGGAITPAGSEARSASRWAQQNGSASAHASAAVAHRRAAETAPRSVDREFHNAAAEYHQAQVLKSGSFARTMPELPAIKETPSEQLAMSQRVPAGNQRPVMGSDPNRTTQKELPAFGHTRESRRDAAAAAAGRWASKALSTPRRKS